MHKKLFFTIIISFFISLTAYSQTDDDFWEHVSYGGNFGLAFGEGYFSAIVSPSAIYQFKNERIAAGTGMNFAYAKDKDFYKSTIWGPSLIGLYDPIYELQLSGEFEVLNVIQNYEDSYYEDENYWYPAFFVGAGYRTENVTFGIRYDVLYKENKSIYANAWMPFIRIYF
ncbi:hypothetical protein NBRC110019_31580 [Neptunitalea chrysea]|uniref:Alpha-ketoglutarate decarboxylase n=1 Tax=Neptunitalea chrysea TaxID=1647581 RepID=A0A9W6B948_9FLAO|nr:alpha-ketoglutarate decarboxylase [Neptunitalea chrysea]GLB54117.1 hypothetical protein NBRC110019_31580 [Neptunitalea chrysea]